MKPEWGSERLSRVFKLLGHCDWAGPGRAQLRPGLAPVAPGPLMGLRPAEPRDVTRARSGLAASAACPGRARSTGPRRPGPVSTAAKTAGAGRGRHWQWAPAGGLSMPAWRLAAAAHPSPRVANQARALITIVSRRGQGHPTHRRPSCCHRTQPLRGPLRSQDGVPGARSRGFSGRGRLDWTITRRSQPQAPEVTNQVAKPIISAVSSVVLVIGASRFR